MGANSLPPPDLLLVIPASEPGSIFTGTRRHGPRIKSGVTVLGGPGPDQARGDALEGLGSDGVRGNNWRACTREASITSNNTGTPNQAVAVKKLA